MDKYIKKLFVLYLNIIYVEFHLFNSYFSNLQYVYFNA